VRKSFRDECVSSTRGSTVCAEETKRAPCARKRQREHRVRGRDKESTVCAEETKRAPCARKRQRERDERREDVKEQRLPAPCPALVSIRMSSGRVWAATPSKVYCNCAAYLNECRGTTRSSWSAVVTSSCSAGMMSVWHVMSHEGEETGPGKVRKCRGAEGARERKHRRILAACRRLDIV
jgi:hypothetical protein